MPQQVFWLPRPFSDLPIPMYWNSGIEMLKGFPSLLRKGQGHSGGTATDFHRVPRCAGINFLVYLIYYYGDVNSIFNRNSKIEPFGKLA